MPTRFVVAVLLGCVLLAHSAPARAQDPASCIDELTEAELDARIRLLDGHFQRNKFRTRLHWYGFISLFAAIGVGQTIMAATADEPVDRFSNYVGAAGAFLTATQLAIIPQVAAYTPQRFRRMPDDTLEQRRDKLRYGLGRLELASTRARRSVAPLAYAVPLVWSATWSTVIMLKFDSPLTVLRLVGGGVLLTGFRILSTPQSSARSWEAVRGSFCGSRYVHRYSDMEMEDMMPSGWGDEPIDGDEPPPMPAVETESQTTVMPSFGGLSVLHVF